MAYRLSRVPFAPEVHALQTEIGSHQGFVAAWNAQNGAVIANPEGHPPPSTHLTPDGGDQRFFCEGQGEMNIQERAASVPEQKRVMRKQLPCLIASPLAVSGACPAGISNATSRSRRASSPSHPLVMLVTSNCH